MDADDMEKELKQAMDDAEAAIDKSSQAIENPSSTPKSATHEYGPDKTSEQVVRELVAEAMADERAGWQGQIDAAEAAAAGDRDRLMRSMAEFENYKRRAQKDVDERIRSALGRLLEDFLPLGDNLHRAKQAAQGSQQIVDGITMVEQSFFTALAKHDIAPVLALGCAFNPAVHEAVAQQPSTEREAGLVIGEVEKGYMWKGNLLRPARVVVSTGGPEDET